MPGSSEPKPVFSPAPTEIRMRQVGHANRHAGPRPAAARRSAGPAAGAAGDVPQPSGRADARPRATGRGHGCPARSGRPLSRRARPTTGTAPSAGRRTSRTRRSASGTPTGSSSATSACCSWRWRSRCSISRTARCWVCSGRSSSTRQPRACSSCIGSLCLTRTRTHTLNHALNHTLALKNSKVAS